ncbi:MAG: hypothetical protein PHI67_11440, partial [Candidatus Methanomethylophilaceae archaeon]|nr:hypothetical protein [Candidatus Methanomethylophilaceae archaeon]
VVDEIERLGGIKPMVFQIQIATVLLAILLIADWLGNYMTDEVAIVMIVLFVICLLSVRYGNININRHLEEYGKVLKQLEDNGDGSNMYG